LHLTRIIEESLRESNGAKKCREQKKGGRCEWVNWRGKKRCEEKNQALGAGKDAGLLIYLLGIGNVPVLGVCGSE